MTTRTVHCVDAIEWLNSMEIQNDSSFVTSMPDISEFTNYSLNDWKNWFIQTATLILSKTPNQGVTIFFQSDIKVDGSWVDKSYLCQKAADLLGHELLWHKIICRSPAGTPTFGRPSYSHLLCFSKGLKVDLAQSTADVVLESGEKTWPRGMPLEACLIVAKFISEQTQSKTVINPFCGEGSVLAAANAFKLNAIGIERSPKRAEKARSQQMIKNNSDWEFQD